MLQGEWRQEYFCPSTATDPRFRGQPPWSMGYGKLFDVLCLLKSARNALCGIWQEGEVRVCGRVSNPVYS